MLEEETAYPRKGERRCPCLLFITATLKNWRIQMGNYALSDIIKRWERGKLTTEQAIGQLLLSLQELSTRVGMLEKGAELQRNGGSTLKSKKGD